MSKSFVESVRRPQPIPGGGAVAAHAAVLALALLEKIALLESSRPALQAEFRASWMSLLSGIQAHRDELIRLREADGAAYQRMARLKASGAGRLETEEALKEAIECPLKIVSEASETFLAVSFTARHCKKHLLSDIRVVCEIIRSAARGAYHICEANLRLPEQVPTMGSYRRELGKAIAEATKLYADVERVIAARESELSST